MEKLKGYILGIKRYACPLTLETMVFQPLLILINSQSEPYFLNAKTWKNVEVCLLGLPSLSL